ncbi:hypothetical protein [Brevundimonas kwangchunensis]|uniref:hypothetical protein n=1 Tax=Brevundimonas kwangchunensis TaxID=322163 RepID=UPI0031D247A4
MTFSVLLRGLPVILGALVVSLAAPAHAQWRMAESRNFVIYSQGSEATLRQYARTLELYDYVLRARMGLPLDAPPARKLPIYLVPGTAALREIRPDIGFEVAGFYVPATEGIFATAIRDRDMDSLLHEYFHHFSFQIGAAEMPGWMIEGLAEYFMTAEVRDNVIRVGDFNRNRADWLLYETWIPLDALLSKRPGEIPRGSQQNTYYPVAWLLTHWFMSDDARRNQLAAYVNAVHGGADPVRAMEAATGLSLRELRSQLRVYMNRSLRVLVYEVDRPEPEIEITVLPASANDLLLLAQRLKAGVPDDQRAATAALVRQRAARHPDDGFAMLQLGHAELHFGDAEVGETVLRQLLERDPANVEALQLMASRQMQLARETTDDARPYLLNAQNYLRRAYAADPQQYYTLYLLAQVRESAPDYPTENDLLTWSLAFERAPQLPGTRLGYASAMMRNGEFEPAIRLLRPLANAPHGGSAGEAARELLSRAEAGEPPLTREEIEAAGDTSVEPAPEEAPEPPAGGGEDDASEGAEA